jgi:membrane protein DedA with SNARE-associated domain
MKVIETIGVPGVGLLMLVENVFPPIPSELVMPLAGFVSTRDGLAFWPVVAAGAAGSLAGAIAWYALARSVGEKKLRQWVDAHGRWLALSGKDIDRAAAWFKRHGSTAVFFGRLIPGVRTLISVPAGIASMPVIPFVLYSAIGTGIWTVALAYAGRLLGSQYDLVETFLGPVTWVIISIIVVLYIVRVIRFRGPPARS